MPIKLTICSHCRNDRAREIESLTYYPDQPFDMDPCTYVNRFGRRLFPFRQRRFEEDLSLSREQKIQDAMSYDRKFLDGRTLQDLFEGVDRREALEEGQRFRASCLREADAERKRKEKETGHAGW